MSEETPNNPNDETSQDQAPQEETPQAEAPDETPQTNEPDPETGSDDQPAEAPEQPEQPQEQEEQPSAPEPPAAAETPKTEKKPDVIPGAELDPIAIEEDTSRLSAEEIARREAEAEERAAREAAGIEDSDDEPAPAAIKPADLAKDARYIATGKRKNSVARVIVKPGNGAIEVNERPIEQYFPRPQLQTIAKQSLVASGYEGTVDVRVRAHGGGISGQAAAVRHGIAKALIEIDPNLRGELKRRGMLTRDSRVKERRKAGLKKARKRPQFSKR
jgi:small subunit ribosomal protein S9